MRAGFSAAALLESLAGLLADPTTARYCLAFSGGADSTALLLALSELRGAHPQLQLRVLHVNHHLHEQAGGWAAHCAGLAERLGISCRILDASIAATAGTSVEAAARTARYALLETELSPGELLLTAHHRDDQFETVLLQLLRGAGVAGLAAMPAMTVFGRGWHLRPLLGFGRKELQQFAAAAGLAWVEDPGNQSLRFDRNFLRRRVLPELLERWPAAAASAARSAEHCAEAQLLLEERARADLAAVRDGGELSIAALRGLTEARARNLLRYWIVSAGFLPPPTAKLQEVLRQMLEARADAAPRIGWSGAELRRYRDRLFIGLPLPAAPETTMNWDWRTQDELQLPAGLGRLRLRSARPDEPALTGLPCPLRVGWRQGSESLRVDAQGRERQLRNLFQEQGVVPWMRRRVPLLYAAEVLVAAGDLWFEESFRAPVGACAMALQWLDRPALF